MEMQRLDSAIGIPVYKTDSGASELPVSMSSTRVDEPDTANDYKPSATGDQRQLQSQSQSRLLSLPAELQLLIWEYTVLQDEPLHVNSPCDSSFGGWTESYYAERELWESGIRQPPLQPPLTQVCRDIRAEALPMYYKHNRFQSGYCYETDMEMSLKWLRMIGKRNRALMKKFYFFDANWKHDVNEPKDLKKVQRGPAVREMGGMMKSIYSDEDCKHEVMFGNKTEDEELEGLESLFSGVAL